MMSMVRLSLIRRLYFDNRMHPGMDTAFEEVYAFAQPFYLNAVTGVDKGSDTRSAFWTGGQSQGRVQCIDTSATKGRNLGKGMIFTAIVPDPYLLVGLNLEIWSVKPLRPGGNRPRCAARRRARARGDTASFCRRP